MVVSGGARAGWVTLVLVLVLLLLASALALATCLSVSLALVGEDLRTGAIELLRFSEGFWTTAVVVSGMASTSPLWRVEDWEVVVVVVVLVVVVVVWRGAVPRAAAW